MEPTLDRWDIRPARPEDDGAVGELLVRAFVETYAAKRPDVTVTEERKRDLRDVAARRRHAAILVAEERDSGKVVGTIAVFRPEAPGRQSWIRGAADLRHLAIEPTLHGRGLSDALVRAAEREVRDWGTRVITLHIRRGISGLGRLYERHGFHRAPEGDLDLPSVLLDGYFKAF